MTQVWDIALSGMRAADTRLAATADNIANLDTPGYQASRVDLVELSGGGVAVAGVSKDTSPGPLLADGKRGSNVDLPSEMVNLIQNKLLYTANAMVVKTADQMTGTLLDMLDTDRRLHHSRH